MGQHQGPGTGEKVKLSPTPATQRLLGTADQAWLGSTKEQASLGEEHTLNSGRLTAGWQSLLSARATCLASPVSLPLCHL